MFYFSGSYRSQGGESVKCPAGMALWKGLLVLRAIRSSQPSDGGYLIRRLYSCRSAHPL